MDYLVLTVGVVAAFCALHLWLRARGSVGRFPVWTGVALGVVLVSGWRYTEYKEQITYERVRAMVEGFPPTYARELERMGHAQIGLETADSDPAYLEMIGAQKRWLEANASVADIYTMRRLPDGRVALVLDSETDYDRDGRYAGEREQRTRIGEIFEKELPALEEAFAGRPTFMDKPYTDRWGHWVSAFVPMRDASGRVEAVCGVDYPADRWLQAIAVARRHAMGITLILAVLLLAGRAIIALLESDLRRREEAEARVRQFNAELEARVAARTADLEATHRQLVDASRRAGMAEVATNVLHSVGNVLNSLTVSTSLLGAETRGLRPERLLRVAELLREQAPSSPTFFTEDPKGRKIVLYVEQLAGSFGAQRDKLLAEIEALRKAGEHMRCIVQSQQGYARRGEADERADARELVEDSLALSADLIQRHEVRIVRELAAPGGLMVEKHSVLQIVVNLVRNACQACAAGGQGERVVRVSLVSSPSGIEIAVADSGVGIAAEVMPRLFTHGFTTRKEGHGFGLHSAVAAARALGGSLTAHSDGPGRGATFRLRLPVAAPAAARAPELVAA